MPCTTPCAECARSGLPILFARYAATYNVAPVGLEILDRLKPGGHFSAMPGGVPLKVGRYNVRMLRAGYLYIRTEVAKVRTPEWEAYVVDPHGYLTRIRIDAPAATKPTPACRPEVWGANRSMVWVKDAAALTSLHYVFHPDPIDPRHLMQVIDKAPDTFMQHFDIAGWVKGNTRQKHTGLPDALDRQLVEYAALADERVQEAMEGQFFGLMGAHPEERGWGRYEEQRIDRPFASNAGGAALGRAQGLRTVARVLGSYRDVHGPRLRQMAEHLRQRHGAVVACEDPMGIAQSLCMSHPMAAAPYELWLQSRPAVPVANFPGLTNGWLVKASGSIDQLLGAMKAGLTASQEAEIEALKEQRRQLQASTLSTRPRYENRLDGSVYFVAPEANAASQLPALDTRIAAMEAQRDTGTVNDPRLTLNAAENLIDRSRIAAFEKLHAQQTQALNQRLEALGTDTVAWLQSAAFLDVGDRYNGKAMSAGGDGERFALQLASALVNLDGSATGREFLGRQNPFTHARDNLVARMIGCDDPAVSAELQAACQRLQASADDLGRGYASDADEARLKLNEAIEAELARFKDAAKAADNLNGLIDSHALDLESRAKGKAEIHNTLIRAAGSGGWLAVVFSAIALSAARGPATRREGTLLAGRALALTHGLGAEATKLLKQEALVLAARLRTNPRYGNKVGLGRVSDWLVREQQMQSLLETHVAQAAKGASIHGALRVQGLALVAEALAVMAGGGTRLAVKRDIRSAFEASGQLLSAVGSLRDIRVLLCEELVFKAVVPEAGQVPVFAKGTGLDQVVSKQLLRLRAQAGRYAIAGTTIAIGLDGLDAGKARQDGNTELFYAHVARVAGGVFSIAGIAIGMSTLDYALLVVRLNIAGLILTTAATVAIEWLKDEAWQEWFKSQPFRISKYSSDGTWVGNALQPPAHKSELQMLFRLADAIQEKKGK